MTEPIRDCEDHGPFATDDGRCPVCGARGDQVVSGSRRRRLSTFLSGALRHFPDDVGLEPDGRGWVPDEDLVAAARRKYDWADERRVDAVIATDPKGRFERTASTGTDTGTSTGDDLESSADRHLVRAAYGHSIDVSLEPTDAPVPDRLYHGTAPDNLSSIREEGLLPMARQQVHLSGSREAARRVGRRHAAEPVVLVVDAAAMLADGHRIAKRGAETYTTDRVPAQYLSRSSD
ncbi:RNA 2'-phosphotransferase [Halobiforma lacisalsi AJ5]|uniref:Probable RNA 2'-phosphotransferase n=1 Tax=Natronobacterium lacisalsi AJ5 TaxID=358396 RepID=M0LER1_NATLA|nr:RNA 2'-phosphotransferase [Halobiforma lacisalsi]APW96646.1 RNA 2'-phosphotransferase [Halobiforma lacisalsi AJ5]EMA32072.1 RNA 2'-phosphotransferase [Halobiforma lacisalsi AJ5]